jgi:hypothetical protein
MDASDRVPAVPRRRVQTHARIALAAAAGCAVGAILVLSALSVPRPASPGLAACPVNTPFEFNNTSYWGCGASIDWNSGSPPTNISFHGVAFEFYGIDSIDCGQNGVNVTGREVSGQTYTLIIFLSPSDCRPFDSTQFSPDMEFGAIYQGGSPISLLVRAL